MLSPPSSINYIYFLFFESFTHNATLLKTFPFFSISFVNHSEKHLDAFSVFYCFDRSFRFHRQLQKCCIVLNIEIGRYRKVNL